jgi:hypothetical protein
MRLSPARWQLQWATPMVCVILSYLSVDGEPCLRRPAWEYERRLNTQDLGVFERRFWFKKVQ